MTLPDSPGPPPFTPEEYERFRLTLEESPEAIFWLEEDGRLAYVNRRACSSLGYTREELCRMHLWDIDPDFPPERWKVQWQTMRSAGRRTFETRHRAKDGRILPVEVCANQVASEYGEYHQSFVRDISERVQARQEHARLEEQLQHSRKMESVGQLAGGVAHDFNNMLSVIVGYTEDLLEENPEGPIHQDLQQIQRAAERSAELTRQLLAFARRQTIAPRVLDLNRAVDSLLKILERLLGENLKLIWCPGAGPSRVRIDPAQVDQILTNLCVNARDAITGQGVVTIETAHAQLDEEYCRTHAEAIPGDFVVLTVSDNGSGIDREHLERIFEPYFTTKGTGSGTGLGLATVFGIVKQNRGRIQVYSEEGEGTTFRIYLPAEKGEVSPELSAGGKPGRKTGSETVLVVEDEQALLALATRQLRRLGYTVLGAGIPTDALDLAREGGPIDLLVTDVIMPGMNGRELASILAEENPDLRTLFVSGYTANVIAHHGVLDSGVCFLAKPFSIQDLAAKVREALDT